MKIRQFVADDASHVWALNALPNIGLTADADMPLDLPVPPGPPAAFPDMADISRTFIEIGGDFLVGEFDGHLVAVGGISPTAHSRPRSASSECTPRCDGARSAGTS